MSNKTYRSWLIALAMLGVFVDQASKYGVFRWLYQHPTRYNFVEKSGSYEVVPGGFRLYAQFTNDAAGDSIFRNWSSDRLPRVNHGALFGLANDHEGGANSIFAGISVLAGVAIVGWTFRRSTARDRLLCAALGLILAGTLGNLFDRLVFGGVRDFLYYYYLVDWPVFNVADCCLVVGAFLLLAHAFLTHPSKMPAIAAEAVQTESQAAPQIAFVK